MHLYVAVSDGCHPHTCEGLWQTGSVDGLNLKSAVAGIILLVVVLVVGLFKDSESGFRDWNPMIDSIQDFDSLELVQFDPCSGGMCEGWQFDEWGDCVATNGFIVAEITSESPGPEVIVSSLESGCGTLWVGRVSMYAGNTSEAVLIGDTILADFLVRVDDDKGVVTASRAPRMDEPMARPTQFEVTKHHFQDGQWVLEWTEYWSLDGVRSKKHRDL